MTQLSELDIARASGWSNDPLRALIDYVRRFVVVTEAQALAVALFVVHSHAIECADATPYLAVTSAEKRSGKSRLLEVLALLVATPLRAAGVSEAALFRSISERQPTLLMDEIDAIFGPKARDHEDLRALLNAGYQRGTPVLRCVGEGSKQKVEAFDVFGAKVLAGIGKLPDTVADRSLPIRLRRRDRSEKVERFRVRRAQREAEPLRRLVEQWVEEWAARLTDAEPELPEELDDRAQDAYEPLLAIADAMGGDWPHKARVALVEIRCSQEPEDTGSIGIQLLTDIKRIFASEDCDRLATKHLLEQLAADKEAPWADWRNKGLTPWTLADILRPYGIRSRTVKLRDGSSAKGFKVEQFADAWKRYLPSASESVTSVQSEDPSCLQLHSEPSPTYSGDGHNPTANRDESSLVTEVTEVALAGADPAESDLVRFWEGPVTEEELADSEVQPFVQDFDQSSLNLAGHDPQTRASALCRYPTHRDADWVAEGGRTVCGICHPPPNVAAIAPRAGSGRDGDSLR